jgi:hypothetical protein
MYEIVEHEVLKASEVKTDTQTARVKLPHEMLYKTKATPSKTKLAISEVATISLQWLIFDLTQETHINDPDNVTPFHVTLGEQTGEVESVNGVGEFTFSSDEVGTYKIVVNGEEIEVVVNA